MAGDWIKFEVATSDKPEVWEIASSLDIDPDAVVGKLLRVWSWFDQHTEKGNAPSVTKKLLDRLVGVTGFCDALIESSWMTEENREITLPNFDRHNGQTAKRRALTAKRVSAAKAKSNAKGNARSVTRALPREEKRREDTKGSTTYSCAEQASPSSAPADGIGTFPVKDKGRKQWALTQAKLDEYRETYQADVLPECRKARQWCIDNPASRKTYSGMPAFLTRWLNKANNRGDFAGGGPARASPAQERDARTMQAMREFSEERT